MDMRQRAGFGSSANTVSNVLSMIHTLHIGFNSLERKSSCTFYIIMYCVIFKYKRCRLCLPICNLRSCKSSGDVAWSFFAHERLFLGIIEVYIQTITDCKDHVKHSTFQAVGLTDHYGRCRSWLEFQRLSSLNSLNDYINMICYAFCCVP